MPSRQRERQGRDSSKEPGGKTYKYHAPLITCHQSVYPFPRYQSFSPDQFSLFAMHSASIWAGLLGCAGLASGCLLPEEREGLARIVPRAAAADNGTPIGTGDRFSGGTVAPQGLGTRASSTSFSTILSTAEIKSGFDGLANTYGLETFTTPYKTYGGATIFGGKVGGTGTCNKAYRVYFNGGIHARERGSSDGVLYFISDLLYANKTGSGLTYGSKSYTNAQVKTALAAGIVFVPLSNPDGVAYDQSTNSCWRKNRNPASSTGSAASVGVDLNRNFDFLWDFTKKFASTAQSSVASTSPSSETYHGSLFPRLVPAFPSSLHTGFANI